MLDLQENLAVRAGKEEENCMLTIRTLGKFQIRNEEHIVNEEEIRSPKMINLLAYLILHRNQTLTFYDMADALWQEEETGNPAGALKNLMYRLRVLLKKNFGEEDFILTDHGSYRWNPRLEVAVDAERFEQMFELAKQKPISEGETIQKLKAALALYQGDFMTKVADMHWVMMLNTYYHSLYLNCVRYLCECYVRAEKYENLEQLCSQALQQESLDEELYCYLIKALAGKNKIGSALEVYENACRTLQQQLGICELSKLKGVYDKLLRQNKSGNVQGIAQVHQDIAEQNPAGAFLCGYPVFREICRLQVRKTARFDENEYILLLTLKAGEYTGSKVSDVNLFRIRNAMPHLVETLKKSLRPGDAVAQFSDSQYVILLSACTYEGGMLVANRIISKFYQDHKVYRNLKIKIHIEKVKTAENILNKYSG